MHHIRSIIFMLLAYSFASCGSNDDNENLALKHSETLTIEPIRSFGDTMLILKRGNSFDTLIRLYSMLEDSQYHVKPQQVTLNKKLDFSHYEYGKMYITRSKEEVKENGLNFAGHYSFIFWGCGSACKLAACVDLKTGRVYNAPSGGIGYSFSKHSRILVVNPADTGDFYLKNRIWQPEQYVWTGDSFQIIKSSR